ncbi:MAG: hypothetical protein DRP18_01375 [Candidatus Aenigmatarchaeota archaeon]|nr:MAG: hypothetical protein DRP18_01375 [Candidatus Aenigmarchaeota archaeon]
MINFAVTQMVVKKYLTPKVIILYLIVLCAPLFFMTQGIQDIPFLKTSVLELKTEYIFGFLLFSGFVWVSGACIGIFSSLICSSFVAEEASDKTLLLMVSKPVSRTGFLLSKFTGFLILALIYSVLSAFASIYAITSFLNLDLLTFFRMLQAVPSLIGFSILVSLFFGSLGVFFSSLTSSKLKVVVPVIGILVFSFFVFAPVRGIARDNGIYSGQVLEFTDLGYDFGNLYVSILKMNSVKTIPFIQSMLGMVTGVYKIPEHMVRIDFDQGFILENLERESYHSVSTSFAKLFLAVFLFLGSGVFYFKKRDIH